jgi:hypothetical protein
LTPEAFRLFACIKRREDNDKGQTCFEGAKSMAAHCRMSEYLYWKALRELRDRNFIREDKWHGRTNQLRTNPSSLWKNVLPQKRGLQLPPDNDEQPPQNSGEQLPQKAGHKGSPSNGPPNNGSPINEPSTLTALNVKQGVQGGVMGRGQN